MKKYDLVYHGRFVQEKGVYFIQDVAKEIGKKILWIGGRSQEFTPSYGTNIGWIDYSVLPKYLNQAKIGVQFPYSHNGYSEQYNYAIAEAMSAHLPVICSDNGSLKEVYGNSPAIFVPQEDVVTLKNEIENLLKDEKLREDLGDEGISWVHNNLSLDVIAHRLLKILEVT